MQMMKMSSYDSEENNSSPRMQDHHKRIDASKISLSSFRERPSFSSSNPSPEPKRVKLSSSSSLSSSTASIAAAVAAAASKNGGNGGKNISSHHQHHHRSNSHPRSSTSTGSSTTSTNPCRAMIVRLLRNELWSNDPKVVEEVLKRLGDLFSSAEESILQDNRLYFASVNGYLGLVGVLHKFPLQEEIQCEGCRVIGNSLFGISEPSIIDFALEFGVMNVVLQAMSTFPLSQDIQKSGCITLQNMIQQKHHVEQFIVAQGLPIVQKAMWNFPNSARLQQFAVSTLWFCNQWDEFDIMLLDAGVMCVLGAAIENYNNNVLQSSTSSTNKDTTNASISEKKLDPRSALIRKRAFLTYTNLLNTVEKITKTASPTSSRRNSSDSNNLQLLAQVMMTSGGNASPSPTPSNTHSNYHTEQGCEADNMST